MKKIIAVVLALCLMLSLNVVAFAAYNDVPEGHWAENAIETWSKNGIFVGDESGNFNPGAYMTRAEAAAIMARLFKLSAKADISQYTDVKADAWYADYLALCVAGGIMNGTSDTTMDPLGKVTREQFFVMFARGLGIPEAAYAGVSIADDAEISSWAKGCIYALVSGGYLKGTSSNKTTVSPKDFINRASVAALLNQTISVYAAIAGAIYPYEGSGIVLVVAPTAFIVEAPAGTTVITKNAPDTLVNGTGIPANTLYIVPAASTSDDQGRVNPVVPQNTHQQIIDEAVQRYIAGYSSDYAKLTKSASTINVALLDPSIQIGKVYSDIGGSILNAIKNQANPAIITVKASMNGQAGQLTVTSATTAAEFHDLVYAVTGFAANNRIGELDGQTIKVSFIDSDCAPFEYSFAFAIQNTHQQIIDEAVQRYIAGYSSDYAKLTKSASTINVALLDPSIQIGKVYSDIGGSILNAIKNQANPAIITVKASMNGQAGQLTITSATTAAEFHDLIYAVTGFAANNTIGELDGQTIKVSFTDSDCAPFEYSFVFAIQG